MDRRTARDPRGMGGFRLPLISDAVTGPLSGLWNRGIAPVAAPPREQAGAVASMERKGVDDGARRRHQHALARRVMRRRS